MIKDNILTNEPSEVGKVLLDRKLTIILYNLEATIVNSKFVSNVLGSSLLLHLDPHFRIKIIHEFVELRSQVRKAIWIRHGNIDFRLFLVKRIVLSDIYILSIKSYTGTITGTTKTHVPEDLSGVSHELRAPLFNIQSFLEFLYEYDMELTQTQRLEFLEIATSETERLRRVVTNMLDFSRLKNHPVQNRTIFKVTQPFINTLRIHCVMASNKRLIVSQKIDVRSDKSFLVGSYDVVVQVLTNLVTNALKFTYPYGSVLLRGKHLQTISIHKSRSTPIVRFSVIDEGIGINPFETETIFTPFSRGDTTRNSLVGTGLGLPLAHELLKLLSSSISLSTYPGKGSHIFFDLDTITPNDIHTEADEGT